MKSDHENCPIDRPLHEPVPKLGRWSEVLIAAIALVPIAIARGLKLRRRTDAGPEGPAYR